MPTHSVQGTATLGQPPVGHKLGIIGAGAFTDFSLSGYTEYLPELILAGITDPKTELAEAMAKQYGIENVYPSVDALLANQQIDVILILTPPNTHFDLARTALEAGKHVLVEKPIAFSPEDAQTLISLAQSKNLQLTANLVLRHHPFHQELRQTVTDGRFGALKQIVTTALLARYPEGHWYWDEHISGGFFLNTFCHFLDLYDFVTGQNPTKLASTGSVESGHVITATYPNSSIASLNINLNATNDQEMVQTVYVFDQAVVTTSGWLPAHMTIHQEGIEPTTQTAPEKLGLYRQALSQIMADLLKRVDNPVAETAITHQTLLNAVVNPTRASQN